jgi:CspA family cold shock protein
VPGDSRLEGEIVRWRRTDGFGFIAPDDATSDVFFHAGDLEAGESPLRLREGARVSYVLGANEKGPKADGLRILAGAGPFRPGPDRGSRPAAGLLTEGQFRQEVHSLLEAAMADFRTGLVDLARARGWLADSESPAQVAGS